MIKVFPTIILFFILNSIHGQQHDFFWVSGYDGGAISIPYDDWGLNFMRFNERSELKIWDNQDIRIDFSLTNGIISDSLGNVVACTNGQHVYGSNLLIAQNGDLIGTNPVANGYNMSQAGLILPVPSTANRYYTFNIEYKYNAGDASGHRLYASLLEHYGTGNDTVLEKRTVIIDDNLAFGQMTAIKHANGRDWWITVPKYFSDKYYQVLLGPSGIYDVDTLTTVDIHKDGNGMAKYAPNGSKYVRAASKILGQPFRIDIFDFDRCTGKLSNQITKYHEQEGFGVGVEFSPDSRYLYIFRTFKVFQYDLTAPDIFATETVVAEYDGFTSTNSNQTGTFFFLSQLGPDGRIYTASTRYGKHLHYMDFPNRPGVACGLVQHGIEMPCFNASSMPNLPNFRLGPVDGSACDTVGVDNHPLARFRWDFEDTLTPLRVTFTDLSAYEPDLWSWDFGDGSPVLDTTASGEVSHLFPAPGTYEVCLTASNVFSQDSVCHTIQIGTTSVALEPASVGTGIRTYPNPTVRDITLHLSGVADWQRVDVELTDTYGRTVLRTAWRGNTGRLATETLLGGTYTASVYIGGRWQGVTKLIKVLD